MVTKRKFSLTALEGQLTSVHQNSTRRTLCKLAKKTLVWQCSSAMSGDFPQSHEHQFAHGQHVQIGRTVRRKEANSV